ncbi:MAG: hypothetical protein FJ272_19745 [Planctomycetes bacterium]|nr:hypothetical protein [Planctomycetota bacterium]
MVAVRIPRKWGAAVMELMKLGPVRCLRGNVFLLTQKQMDALGHMKLKYERLRQDDLRKKMASVVEMLWASP